MNPDRKGFHGDPPSTPRQKETRAWTFKARMTAPQAAGLLHIDFELGFIRAKAISLGKLLEGGSLA